MNSPSPTDRRGAPRRQPAVDTVCRLEPGPGVGLVWNISPGGLSMLFHDVLVRGTTVRGVLATADDRFAVPMSMRVTHVTALRTGDYLIGGPFENPLAAEEMNHFLAGAGR